VDFGALVLPAALVFGAPASPGTYDKGLFCETVELVEEVVHSVDRGARTRRVIAEINGRFDRVACVYLLEPAARGQLVRLEKTIETNEKRYSIYEVRLISLGTMRTEVGDIEWTFSLPITMYTLRQADPARTVAH
jgi:hypothetical protein